MDDFPQTFQTSLSTDYLLSSPTPFGPLWIHTRLGGFQDLDCVAHKELHSWHYSLCCCCSVAQSCPTLCDPMDCSMPGFFVPHHRLEFAQVHVHCIDDAIQLSLPLIPSSPSALNLSWNQGLFQWVLCSHQITKILELHVSISPSSEYSGLISLKID